MFPNKISHDQQIQVVIRFKQSQQLNHHSKCLYVSPNDSRQLIVETPTKKQYFLFDSIATEASSQQQIYSLVGKPILEQSTQGFNCCVFAYGQTGAGKTFSILGHAKELHNDLYSAKRGILPRLLSDLFVWSRNQTARCSISASYMEIYNQQIIDLLNTQIKIRQIRQDAKKGVYVDGLSEQIITSYEQSIDVLLRGLKSRKIAATEMNAQSSRSHTIFTLNIEFQVREGQNLKFKRSKINIVDLAGSERARLTKVQGERLKQGCNINRSLLVLGNVINALIESTKKKKYIPFRDSKLTYFLKDSLGGNSVTRLLANVDPNKKYLSQTVSTLMFAKRAKIIKMKVQMNQNVIQNFDCLRREIRQLRQQLAEARYIKNNCSKITDKGSIQFDQESIFTLDRFMDTSGFDFVKNENVLQVLEENQKSYKAMIQIYESHMENCELAEKSKKNLSMHQQWKTLEKKNEALIKLSRNIPSFTKIFRENIILKNQLEKSYQNSFFKSRKNLELKKLESISVRDQSLELQSTSKNKIPIETFNSTIEAYQELISQLKERMKQSLQKLQISYEQLLSQNKQKDQKIKQLLRKKQVPVSIEELQNENQLLKLNILELQSELARMQDEQSKKHLNQNNITEQQFYKIIDQVQAIKIQAEEEAKQNQLELENKQQLLSQMKQQLKQIYQENQILHKQLDHLANSNKELKKKMAQLLKISSESQINMEATNTFWTSEQESASEQFIMNSQFLYDKRALEQKTKLISLLEKQQQKLANNGQKLDEQTQKCFQLSNQILKLHQDYGNQITNLKTQLRQYQVQRKFLKEQSEMSRIRIRTIQQQCGKPFPDIIEEYKDMKKSNDLILHSPKPKNYGLYSPPMTFRKTKQTNLGFREHRNKNDNNKKQQKSLKKNNPMKNSGILKPDIKLKKQQKVVVPKKK